MISNKPDERRFVCSLEQQKNAHTCTQMEASLSLPGGENSLTRIINEA